jgi:FkbM family methyltransferase
MTLILQRIVNFIPYRLRGLVRYLPIVKQVQQKLMATQLAGANFNHTIRGGPASGLIYPVTLPLDKGIWIGNYEEEFSEALAAAVTPGTICYDIGGFRGFFTGVMACQGATEVHVFEPLPENIDQLDRIVRLNPSLPIKVHRCALGDLDGEVTFHVMPEVSMGKIEGSLFKTEDSSERQLRVFICQIDTLLANKTISPAAVLKIDVEGAEASVLRGGVGLISRHRPTLFIEVHSHELSRECVKILEPLGYAFTVLETGRTPDYMSEPAVCHLRAVPIKPCANAT